VAKKATRRKTAAKKTAKTRARRSTAKAAKRRNAARGSTREAVVWHKPYAALKLPDRTTNTFILRSAASLSASDQQRLLDWLGGTGRRTQIISTAESPLFTLVEGGLFDATLYYRLNVMLLRVGVTASLQINQSAS